MDRDRFLQQTNDVETYSDDTSRNLSLRKIKTDKLSACLFTLKENIPVSIKDYIES